MRCPTLIVLAALAASSNSTSANATAAELARSHAEVHRLAEQALNQGIAWLLAHQAADGGWHSSTYGQMRRGAGHTALALYALAASWERLSPDQQRHVRRGVEFLAKNLDDAGCVQTPDGPADYPTYSTSLLVLALQRAKLTEWAPEQQRMRSYLAAAQLFEPRSSATREEAAGGWGPLGGDPQYPASWTEVNISVTRFALEALGAARDQHRESIERGARLAKLLQNLDPASPDYGGFHFTIDPRDPLNKAGWVLHSNDPAEALAYGTSTADGLCALLACGISLNDPRTRAAVTWLERHADLDSNPGVSSNAAALQADGEALMFYYYASLAHAIKLSSNQVLSHRARPLIQRVVALQHADGSWSNPSTAMREDDPIIASALAIDSLATLITVGTPQ